MANGMEKGEEETTKTRTGEGEGGGSGVWIRVREDGKQRNRGLKDSLLCVSPSRGSFLLGYSLDFSIFVTKIIFSTIIRLVWVFLIEKLVLI